MPPTFEPPAQSRLAQASGFSLHAGIGIGGGELEKLERLCRYVSRPALATERLALTAGGGVRYTLKSPYRDGTTHVLFEPLDFMARLAALVPLPHVHLTRFHGLFAPHARLRAAITPAGRGASAQPRPQKHHAMRWMQRLKRAFRIDIETCQRCGGKLRIIASIEDPGLIRRILEHLESRMSTPAPTPPRPGSTGAGLAGLNKLLHAPHGMLWMSRRARRARGASRTLGPRGRWVVARLRADSHDDLRARHTLCQAGALLDLRQPVPVLCRTSNECPGGLRPASGSLSFIGQFQPLMDNGETASGRTFEFPILMMRLLRTASSLRVRMIRLRAA